MYENDYCQVMTPEGAILAEGTILSNADGEIEIDVDGSVDGRVVPAGEVRARVRSVVKGEVTHIGWVVAGQLNRLFVDLGAVLDVVQLRESVREAVDLEYVLEPDGWIALPDGPGEDELPTEQIRITVLDLSAQGMRFETRADLPLGAQLRLTLTHTRQPVEVHAELVRKEQGGHRPAYGCRFIDLSQRSADEIFRYILAQQSERRRRSLA